MSPASRLVHIRQGCDGKRRYGQRAARRAARQLNDSQAEAVHAYACVRCNSYHVGSNEWAD
jgi:ribosomal protein L37AE/L43A